MLSGLRKFQRACRFSQGLPPPKMIPIKVKIDDEVQSFAFPMFSKLAKNLERVGVPLEFECGYCCSCGTCAVMLDEQLVERLEISQPRLDNETRVCAQNSFDMKKVRLSCQLFVSEELENITIEIQ